MSAKSDFIIQGSELDEQLDVNDQNESNEPKEKEEEKPKDQKDLMKGEIASERDLVNILCKIFDSLSDEEAVEIKAYRECILVGKRHKNQSSSYFHKFTNFGLSTGTNRTAALAYAIRAIDGNDLPDYCYKALDGNINALRDTTKHLVKVYDKKIERLKGMFDNLDSLDVMYAVIEDLQLDAKSPYEIVKAKLEEKIAFLTEKRKVAENRLKIKDNEEFVKSTEPVLIEIPRNYEVFHDKTNDYVAIVAGDNITP